MSEIARQIARFMAGFKNASNALERQLHEEMRKLELDHAEEKNVSDAGQEVAPRA